MPEPIRAEINILVRRRDASQQRIRMLAHMARICLTMDDTAVAIMETLAGPLAEILQYGQEARWVSAEAGK
ncbi:hypothetical protein ABIA68_000514 [Stenotrophomonas rhizophila]|uniref:hypothetical protein n=1 Tax=Stenotrophomonas rhizophila TaxID=216778 RepID=UPI00339A2DFD